MDLFCSWFFFFGVQQIVTEKVFSRQLVPEIVLGFLIGYIGLSKHSRRNLLSCFCFIYDETFSDEEIPGIKWSSRLTCSYFKHNGMSGFIVIAKEIVYSPSFKMNFTNFRLTLGKFVFKSVNKNSK